ncbi:hypothetical protein DFQ09_106206 [Winogradskyella pacifica]|uniref:C1q domain-containing protein n=1 Tax=Winogradskyella pacifica TaxID=664642 RepID=A0A3D9LMX2_9FLAO|nr:hypothetical protein [Winogradskyella pacifica]REE08739.1 hypothetical protein DFQ09_106206 [Winogradskyella pacifica]
MKNKLVKVREVRHRNIVFYALLIMVSFSYAQVGVGNTDPKASLDITASNQATPSNTDGILIPRIDAFPGTSPTAAQDGMLVYLTTTVGLNSKGFYHWDQATTSWIRFSSIEKLNDLSDAKSDVDGSEDGSSIFIGIDAGVNDDATDNNNVGVGYKSLELNVDGNHNSAFGYATLSKSTVSNNSAFGFSALENNTLGVGNSAFGKRALEANTIANQNTAMGADALRKNTGSTNTAIGNGAMFENTLGSDNVAVGNLALTSNKTGNGNTAVGTAALNSNTADQTTAVGYHALYKNLDGTNNTGVGYEALNENVNGSNNSAFGYGALKSNTSGNNSAFGSNALGLVTSGVNNVAVGTFSGSQLITGGSNVFVGHNSGRSATGDENVFIGKNTGRNTTGSSNVFIGNNAGLDSSFGSAENTLVIQNSSSDTPLIYGEFNNNIFRVNGEVQVADPSDTGYAFPKVDGTANQILVTDGTGQLTFEDQQTIPVVADVSTFSLITTTFDPAGAAQTIAGGTPWVKINFNNVTLNATGSTELSSGSQFIASTAGFYRINASYHTDNSQANTEYFGIAVVKNGTNFVQEFSANHYNNATNPSQVARQISSVVELTIGDTIEIQAQSSATGAVIDKFTGKTYFTIERIR